MVFNWAAAFSTIMTKIGFVSAAFPALGNSWIIVPRHVEGVGSLTDHGDAVFNQESPNKLRRMGGCIIVMDVPR